MVSLKMAWYETDYVNFMRGFLDEENSGICSFECVLAGGHDGRRLFCAQLPKQRRTFVFYHLFQCYVTFASDYDRGFIIAKHEGVFLLVFVLVFIAFSIASIAFLPNFHETGLEDMGEAILLGLCLVRGFGFMLASLVTVLLIKLFRSR